MADRSIISPAFSDELRRRRTAAGLSLAQLAKKVHYSKSHLCKVELGGKAPSVALARACDQELEAGGTLTRLVQPQAGGAEMDLEVSCDEWMMRFSPDGTSEFNALNRRTSLTGMAGAAGLSWPIPAPLGARHAAEHALPAFRRWLAEIRALGQSADPALVCKILIPTVEVVQGLAVNGPAASRQAALRLAARFAEFTGWMAQEQGNETAALWWTGYAVKLATAGDDAELQAYAFVRRAELALYRDDSMTTVELARRVQGLNCDPRTRSLAAQREAQGLALAGDEKGCHQALARAAELMAHAAPSDQAEPVLGSTNMPNPVLFATGWCLQDLGRPEEAAEVLLAEMVHLRPGAHRMRARYGARLALALASMGETDRSCEVLQQVLDVAQLINSATVRSDLRHLSRTFNRWRRRPAVRLFTPRLTAALRVNTP